MLCPIIHVRTGFQYLNHGQCRTWQDTFQCIVRIVQISNVAVQIGAIQMAEPFHVTLVRDGIANIIVLRRAGERFPLLTEDRVVHDDSMHPWIVICIHECAFDIDWIVDDTNLVSQSIGATGLPRPFGILLGRWIIVGQQSDQQRRLCEIAIMEQVRTITCKINIHEIIETYRSRVL